MSEDLNPVIVRAKDAGVHFGYLVSRQNSEVVLRKSRRIWRWYGAWTLSEIATSGLDRNKSRVAAAVDEIVIMGACEIISCHPDAVASIEGAKWAQ